MQNFLSYENKCWYFKKETCATEWFLFCQICNKKCAFQWQWLKNGSQKDNIGILIAEACAASYNLMVEASGFL